jgi:hypothetical protein
MFEWLKTILGDAYTEDIDTAVAKEIGKAFVAKNDFNTTSTEKKALEDQLKELAETLKAKPEELKVKVTELLTTAATASEEHAKKLAQVKLDAAVDTTLTKAGAVNLKAVKALLDPSKISLDDKGIVAGLDDQITAIKSTDAWAFTAAQPPAPPPKSGERHGSGGGNEKTLADEISEKLFPASE